MTFLQKAIRLVRAFVGEEREEQIDLSVVCIDQKRVCATDGHCLAIAFLPEPDGPFRRMLLKPDDAYAYASVPRSIQLQIEDYYEKEQLHRAGQFPNVDSVRPMTEPVFIFSINPAYLELIGRALKEGRGSTIQLQFFDTDKGRPQPMRAMSDDETAEIMVMPMQRGGYLNRNYGLQRDVVLQKWALELAARQRLWYGELEDKSA